MSFTEFTKYNNVIWVSSFLAKNHAFYDPQSKKLYNQTDVNGYPSPKVEYVLLSQKWLEMVTFLPHLP